jgi:hypothetical protein
MIYFGKLPIIAVTATDAAAGFPASNVALESLGRPWRSTSTGAKDVILDMGASVAIDSLFVHDVNFASALVATSPDNITYTPLGTLNTFAGRRGRRRGRISVSATTRFLKISISAGTPSDGAAFWRIGAGYVFSSKVKPAALPDRPLKVTTLRPQVSGSLPNQIPAVAAIGSKIDRIEFAIPRVATDSLDDFIQRPEAGSILLDLEDPAYPEQIWPVRYVENSTAEQFDEYQHSVTAFVFYEIV